MKKMFGGAPVKGAFIHGALLLVVLVYGYKVWTRDKTADAPAAGNHVVWNKSEAELVAVEYSAPNRTVKLERKGEGAGSYWWGTETKETPPPPVRPPPPMPTDPDPGTGSGSAGKPATPKAPGAGSAAKPATPKPPGAGSAAKPPGAGSAATPPPAPKAPAAGSAGPAKWGPGSGSAGSGSAGSGSGAGSATTPTGGSGAGSGSATTPDFDPISGGPTPDQPPPVTTTREFPVGEGADKVIKGVTAMRAVSNLGKLDDARKKEYKLDETSITLSIVFKSGTKSFVIGSTVHGSADKYALDTDSGIGYVLSGSYLLTPLEQGESGLRLGDPKGFPADSVQRVTAASGGKAKTALRMMADAKPADPANPHAPPTPAGKTKTWGDPATGKPDQTLANFIDNVDKLKPTKYEAELDPSTMTEVVTLTYQDGKGSTLGTMKLLKRDKPAEGPAPATVEYYILTEKTRVPGLVPKGLAERVDQDVPTVFPP